ncbi:hypothetical protein [Flavobacterium hydrophilum]|uniref:HEAT repeat domain-containing protein n=1 Tax=Flavobacterium hydrophilum TaxID=2211445 RepID=A0A2V4BXE0_9FLAO|nr:hypothetical protein [Flavobacterium hydrophilum]PXY43302.1 hypothetical protein DMB68_21740 [Flavobacterium hydrophilum]
MAKIWELYKNSHWVEPFLIGSICLFVGISAVLYLLITASRNKKIKQEKLREEYDLIIVELMYAVVFMDAPFSSVKDDQNYAVFLKNPYFREVLTESVINLHKNYDGIYAIKLEEFYKESELINSSFKKLKNRKWEVKCKGITELAEMNITDSFDTIVTISKSKNKTLKITAINACIKLGGTTGIIHLTEHPYPIDNWTQLNIINAFKKHDIGDTQGVEYLLESKNTTVVSLGLKLIKELKFTQKLSHVEELAEKAPNILIQYEAQSVVQALTVNLISK